MDVVEGYAISFQQAADMVEKEYNPVVCQNIVKNFLKSLWMRTYVTENMDMAATLGRVYKNITKLSRQAPIAHHGDVHNIEFRCSAVTGYEWARDPFARVVTNNPNFQQIYSEFWSHFNWEQKQKFRVYEMQYSREEDGDVLVSMKTPLVLCLQSKLYMPKKTSTVRAVASRNFSGSEIGKNDNYDPLSISGCFNYKDPHHLVKNFRKLLKIARDAAYKREHYEKN